MEKGGRELETAVGKEVVDAILFYSFSLLLLLFAKDNGNEDTIG